VIFISASCGAEKERVVKRGKTGEAATEKEKEGRVDNY